MDVSPLYESRWVLKYSEVGKQDPRKRHPKTETMTLIPLKGFIDFPLNALVYRDWAGVDPEQPGQSGFGVSEGSLPFETDFSLYCFSKSKVLSESSLIEISERLASDEITGFPRFVRPI